MRYTATLIAAAGLLLTAAPLTSSAFEARQGSRSVSENTPQIVRDMNEATSTGAQIEVGFSPNEGAEGLVLRIIGSAKKEIRLLSYSFTSAPITEALLAAKHRGVDVAMAVDHKSNISEDRSGKARHALNALANAGVRIRTVSAFAIHHDKTIIVDGKHTETGSYNYSEAAAHKNSENVILLWNNPELATRYLKHWEARYSAGQDYQVNY